MTRANWKIGPEAGVFTRFQCFNIYLWQDSPLNMEGLIGLKDRVILNAVIKPLIKQSNLGQELFALWKLPIFFIYFIIIQHL